MHIYYHETSETFHLQNETISYIMKVLPNRQLGQLYFGQAIHDRESFDYLLEMQQRSMTTYAFEGDRTFSLEHIKQEYQIGRASCRERV